MMDNIVSLMIIIVCLFLWYVQPLIMFGYFWHKTEGDSWANFHFSGNQIWRYMRFFIICRLGWQETRAWFLIFHVLRKGERVYINFLKTILFDFLHATEEFSHEKGKCQIHVFPFNLIWHGRICCWYCLAQCPPLGRTSLLCKFF